jgi:type I restriction enzyme M protein
VVTEQQLQNITNTFRDELGDDDIKKYIRGFISYKYLSEKIALDCEMILQPARMNFSELDEDSSTGQEYIEILRETALDTRGYFLKPSEMFTEMVRRGNADGKSQFILDDLTKLLSYVSEKTTGSESKEDFDHQFEGIDLKSSTLGEDENSKNDFIVKLLSHVDEIDLIVDDYGAEILDDVYDYLKD